MDTGGAGRPIPKTGKENSPTLRTERSSSESKHWTGSETLPEGDPLTTIIIEADLYPTAPQLARLRHQEAIARQLWKLLAKQREHDLTGKDVSLLALYHSSTRPSGGRAQFSITRTTLQRMAEVRELARMVGWAHDLPVVTLDDLVAEFGRAARQGSASANRPTGHHLFLGSLARPVGDLAVEIGGLDTLVPAALFALPAPVRRALVGEHEARVERLEAQSRALVLAAGQGDPGANAALASHLARWGAALTQMQVPVETLDPVVKLTLRERTRLTWAPTAEGGGPRLAWTFQVDEIAPPGRRGLVAADPGMRRLWTTQSEAGIRRFGNPMRAGVWPPPDRVLPVGVVKRPQDDALGELLRRALLVRHWLHPVQRAAEMYLLDHPALVLELPNLAGFARLRAEYLPWAAWSGATSQYRYLTAIAGVSRRVVEVPAHAAATRTCAACHKRGSMRFRRRSGRCRGCRVTADRDDNAAKNLYRIGLEHL